MNRRLLLIGVVGALALASLIGWKTTRTRAQPPGKASEVSKAPSTPLPVAQVILFNSGVAYFQREGDVEESTRVDLSFPATDVNDLLKSLVLEDMGGGKITSISYDSHDPIDKTLKSFALDLTANPTFGQILNQARGEKIEVTLMPGSPSQESTVTGAIVGMESQVQPSGKEMIEVHQLNLLCTQGMRSLLLSQVQRVRFLNPVLEKEFERALEVLASTHDTQKKMVSLGFSGQGKRPVRVGYVVENPIWKTNYRLILDNDGKPFLQGWAVVENTSDDDWNNVRMILVSGRPISFQMDLYQPLYIPRPTVEPELFASLRPPTYSGALVNTTINPAEAAAGINLQNGVANQSLGMVGGGFGAQNPMMGAQGNGQNLFFNRYQVMNGGFGNAGGQWGLQGSQLGQMGNLGGQNGQQGGNFNNDSTNNRLTYDQLQQRRQQQQLARGTAKQLGSQLAAMDPGKSIASVASAEEIGDYFQYLIDHKVSLPRQKSALLPIVNQGVEAAKVSIFNESVHPKFPLLGLKFKNTTGQNLVQGPITVYEGGSYAGDARIMDLQPNEDRLLSYAIDLGTEVKAETIAPPHQLTAVKIAKGVLVETHKLRETKVYLIKNRSEHERVVLVEHPFRADWKLVTPEKPAERSREVYRFQVTVPAGKPARQEVVEEQTRLSEMALLTADDKTVSVLLRSTVSSAPLKEALTKAVAYKNHLADTQKDLDHQQADLKAIGEDQTRLRANFEKLPPTSAAYKRYLEKFDTQETEIEKLQAQIKQVQEKLNQERKEYEDYVAGLNVE